MNTNVQTANEYRRNYIEKNIEHAKRKFKHFRADLPENNDIVQIINWANENGSFEYRMRIIFDINSCHMFITGDLGEACFNFTEKATLEAISKYSDLNYFREKMTCTTNNITYDPEYAKLQLYEYLNIEEKEGDDRCAAESLIYRLTECCEEHDGRPVYPEYMLDELKTYDEDYWEWLYQVGILPHMRTIIWWYALKCIRRYLENN